MNSSMALTEIGTGAAAAGNSKLLIALAVSFVLHAVPLSLHFTFPDASRKLRNRALDIVLVNARSERKPTEAQVQAQANLDGGGTSDEDRVAKTPLPPSPREQSGNDLEQTQKRIEALEEQQRSLLQANKGKRALPPPRKTPPTPTPQPTPEAPVLNGFDLANQVREAAVLEAQIARQTEEYNKRPRVKNLGLRAEKASDALYQNDWQAKIERIGTLNYPQAARGKLSGSLILTVFIKSDGVVERIEIDRPSGHRVLDEAAQRIVRMAEPFARFTPEMLREGWDQISITRKWTFTSSNQLQTEQTK